MENNPILPNPFKILEEQIAKKESLNNKCNDCVENDKDEKEDRFINLKGSQSIKEGFKRDEDAISWWLILSAIPALLIYGGISHKYLEIPKFENIPGDGTPNNIIDGYKKLLSENNSSIKMNTLAIGAFILMSYLGGVIAIEHKNKMGFIVLIGFIMFGLSKSTAIIEFFENTFGYLFLIIFGLDLNMYMQSDNFASIMRKDPDKVSISFNPLITLFNIENFAEKFTQIRFQKDEETTDTNNQSSDFFAYYNEKGEGKESFFNYLLEQVKMKRIIGNSIWLLLTTFFTIGIMKGTNV